MAKGQNQVKSEKWFAQFLAKMYVEMHTVLFSNQ